MKKSEIEMRINLVQSMLAKETNVSTLATLNHCLERLIMMDPEPDDEESAEEKARIQHEIQMTDDPHYRAWYADRQRERDLDKYGAKGD